MKLIYEYLALMSRGGLGTMLRSLSAARTIINGCLVSMDLRKLVEHIWKVVGIASTCPDIDELKKKMEELYGKETGLSV